MRLKMGLILTIVALMAVASSACSASALPDESSQPGADPISGEWEAAFTPTMGNPFTLIVALNLQGDKVTGTYKSSKTGNGGDVNKGSWSPANNKIAITLESDHGSLALVAILKQGRLVGEWDAGHASGKWEAIKKEPRAKSGG